MSTFASMKVSAQRGMLFETPIVQARLENGDAFLDALRDTILTKKQSAPVGLQRSNVGGWHSDTDMMQWGGPEAADLAKRAIAIAKPMSYFKDMDVNQIKWRIQMWANVSGPGDSNHMHVHVGNLWSAVLYIDMGGEGPLGDDIDGMGGEFYFEDPRFPLSAMHNTGFRLVGMDGKPQAVQPNITPKRGDILFFPAWLRHGVRPYHGTRERISIAINLDAE